SSFFFQAENGIRDFHVTGVQTCALPICTTSEANSLGVDERMDLLDALIDAGLDAARLMPGTGTCAITDTVRLTAHAVARGCAGRSEERRAGEGGRSRASAEPETDHARRR